MNFIISFVSGFFTAVSALVGELIAFSFLSMHQASQKPAGDMQDLLSITAESSLFFLFLSVCIEETFKYIALKKTSASTESPSIPSLLLFGIGFFSLEALLLSIHTSAIDASDTFHIISIALIHILTVLAIGLSIRKEKYIPHITLASVIFFHFLYNITILHQDNFASSGIIFLLASFLLGLLFTKKSFLA